MATIAAAYLGNAERWLWSNDRRWRWLSFQKEAGWRLDNLLCDSTRTLRLIRSLKASASNVSIKLFSRVRTRKLSSPLKVSLPTYWTLLLLRSSATNWLSLENWSPGIEPVRELPDKLRTRSLSRPLPPKSKLFNLLSCRYSSVRWLRLEAAFRDGQSSITKTGLIMTHMGFVCY